MDLQRKSDGRLHFSLGPVERWVVLAVVSVFGFLSIRTFNSVMDTLADQAKRWEDQDKRMAGLSQQQAITNTKLDTLTVQLADVPKLTTQIAELNVRMTAVEEQVKEVRQVRGLK